MYRKDSEGWLKHADFIILDMLCLQLAYVLAYAISGYGFNPYATIIYRRLNARVIATRVYHAKYKVF